MSTLQGDPLFLVGTGRCGSTIAYSCLAMHPDFSWIPSWVDAFPRFPRLSLVNRVWNLPGTDRFRETRFVPKPVEPNGLFAHWLPNYYSENMDNGAVEIARAKLVPLIERMRKAQGKPRFMAKMVGRPVKVELLAHIFPNAFFVNVIRDLKPTVCSLLQVEFYHQTALTPWPWGPIRKDYLELYEKTGQAPEVAAGIKVRLNRAEVSSQLLRVAPAQWMELEYAGFVGDPISHIHNIASSIGLSVDSRFLSRVGTRRLYGGADQKWKSYFNAKQIENLEKLEALPEAP